MSPKLFFISFFFLCLARLNPPSSEALEDCQLINKVLSNLGRSMSKYRLIIAEGGEPSEMLWTIHFCKSLVTVTTALLGGSPVGEDYMETMKEVVIHITAITETLGQSAFGDNLDCRWHGFIVNHVCRSTFGES